MSVAHKLYDYFSRSFDDEEGGFDGKSTRQLNIQVNIY